MGKDILHLLIPEQINPFYGSPFSVTNESLAFMAGMRKAYKGYFLISYLVISSGKT